MDTQQVVDVVIIGGGPAGENVAERVVRGGLSAAVVEAELLGGECSYWACVPSKAMLRPIDLVAAARRSPGASQAVTGLVDATPRSPGVTKRPATGTTAVRSAGSTDCRRHWFVGVAGSPKSGPSR